MVLPTMTERTIQPEDLFRFQFLQDAKLSPDGRHIAFCLSHIDAQRDEECAGRRVYPGLLRFRQVRVVGVIAERVD